MAETFICEYCEKQYSSKSKLSLHQKTAKKCLAKRDNGQTVATTGKYCKYCEINVPDLEEHNITCVKYNVDRAERLKDAHYQQVLSKKQSIMEQILSKKCSDMAEKEREHGEQLFYIREVHKKELAEMQKHIDDLVVILRPKFVGKY